MKRIIPYFPSQSFRLFVVAAFLLLVSSVNRLSAQEVPRFEWAKSFGGIGAAGEQIIDLKIDVSGNILVTGFFTSATDFDPGSGTFTLTPISGVDIFIAKFNSNGDLIWAKRIGGNDPQDEEVKALELDNSGNVYLTGQFYGTVDFDPNATVFNLTSAGSADVFIVKLTSNGDFVWAGRVGGIQHDQGYDIVVDNSGNVFTTGDFSATVDFDPGPGTVSITPIQSDVFVLKLDANGNYQWARNFGSVEGEESHTLGIDGSGNLIITGGFYGYVAPFDFDPGPAIVTLTPATTSGQWDIYIAKINNTTGDIVWARAIAGLLWDRDEGIAIDNLNNILITGYFQATTDFDPGSGIFELTAVGQRSPFIVKLTSAGDFAWAKAMPNSSAIGAPDSRGDAITTDLAGNVYASGQFQRTIDFDPGPGVFNLVSKGQSDVYISKLDASGNFVWAYSIGSTNFDFALGIAATTSDEVYVAGSFSLTADFDPGACTFNMTSTGGYDAYIQKIKFGATPTDPTISSFSPTSGLIGITVTLNGTNFDTTPANNGVTFNGTAAVVTASTATSITTTVPVGATTGKISVTVNCVAVQSAADFTVGGAVAPTITSFAPVSGPVGTTVTITGTNFSSTPANNIVYFGATQAVVTAATATQLTVTVPVGATYQPISVLVNGLLAYSSKPFITTFAGGGTVDACSFAPKQDLTAGMLPVSIASGDFDGDGKADMAVANYDNNILSLFRNTSSIGSISFAAKIDITSGSNTDHISTDDLDGDGKLDLVVTDGGGASVFLNTSTGIGTISFAARISFAAGGSDPRHLAIDDFDKDGKPDLVVANYGAGVNTISVLRNTSSGPGNISYAPKVDFASTVRPSSVSAGDLDGDGKADIAVVNQNSNTLSVFRNTSTGVGNISFAAKVDFTTDSNPLFVSIGDLDDDNKPELAVGYSLGNSVISVFRNLSSGIGNINYAPKADFAVVSVPFSVHMGDLDGDGKLDLVATSVSSGNASVFRNTSNGIGTISFAGKVDFTTNSNSQSVSITDFDGDGKPDLAATSFFGVHVLRNTIFLAPTITSFTPATDAVGTSVTITGTNFSAIPSNNFVQFNGVDATVISSTATSITTAVPSGATTGKISITIGCNTATSANDFTVTTNPNNQPPVIEASTSAAPINGIVTIDLLRLISDPDDNLDLSTLSLNDNVSEQGAAASITQSFELVLDYGSVAFAGTDRISLSVCDLVGECDQQNLSIEVQGDVTIYNAISPNGDDLNKIFYIKYIDLLPETQKNKVTIYNRWGSQVFEVTDYNNTTKVFSGFNNNGGELPSGTYYYKIEFAAGKPNKTGYLALKR